MNNAPVGVFDSGVGGISVLRRMIELMPDEKYIYYGDSANAPYGVKSDEEVWQLSFAVFEKLIDKGVKAVVVACNTATSVAVKKLREIYPQVPIVGIEPAIKPAVLNHKNGRIVVMATQATLRRRKFAELMLKYSNDAEIIPMACPGLMEFIEQDRMDTQEMIDYLNVRYDKLKDKTIDAVVLGCTHYPFIEEQIQMIAGTHAEIYDGSIGTARELKRQLEKNSLTSEQGSLLNIEILNSSGQERVELCKKLLVK